MDGSWSPSPIEFGQPDEPNKWLTLDALRVVKLLYSQHSVEGSDKVESSSN
jgi:hypothetical protein